MKKPQCRFCDQALEDVFVDLGMSPLSNSYLAQVDLLRMEPFYPLKVYLCSKCLLVQLPQTHMPEAIFREYAYFSSYSESWLKHAESYVQHMLAKHSVGQHSFVMELASNDGYLLKYFMQAGVPVLGIEPAANVAAAANTAGIPTISEFFGTELATKFVGEKRQADLVVANNVLAHVPALNDFVAGIKLILKPEGIATIEVPHLLELIRLGQFDTIYHEHFSYFSFLSAEKVLAAGGLTIFDVEPLPTHGGSLRLYTRHAERQLPAISENVAVLRARECAAGLDGVAGHAGFSSKAERMKHDLLTFLLDAKERGKRVAGYGAPAKGNTLLNYCGIRSDLLEFTVDRSPHKQGKYLPGTHIFVDAPEAIMRTRPDYVLILPLNIKDEVMEQMAPIRKWGGQFVVPVPELSIS